MRQTLVAINLNNEILAAAGRQKSNFKARPAPKEERIAAAKCKEMKNLPILDARRPWLAKKKGFYED